MKRFILPIISLVLPFILFQIINGSDIGSAYILIFFLLATPLLLIMMILGISKHKSQLILPFPLFVLAVLLSYGITNIQLEENKQVGEIIARKLEAFKLKNGSYPERLDLLVPDYIENVPKEWYLFLSHEFEYLKENNGQGFSLFVKKGSLKKYEWTNGMDEWQYMD